ncbi:MAG: hypothetical protein GXX96_14095 [Planctomycetaceae bacterium]|nr:hypothetical protein [Planctomycetaceae bacterium]
MSAIFEFLPSTAFGSFFWASAACLPEPGGLLGYVGPGAGLSMLGSLFAVACVLLLALLGPILYTIRLLRSMLRRRRAQRAILIAGCDIAHAAPSPAEPVVASLPAAEQVFSGCPCPGESVPAA